VVRMPECQVLSRDPNHLAPRQCAPAAVSTDQRRGDAGACEGVGVDRDLVLGGIYRPNGEPGAILF